MKNMRFSDLRLVPHEYQLKTIKRLLGGVKVVRGFLAYAYTDRRAL